jgi:hypothetical protein
MGQRGAKPTRTKQLVMEAWLRKDGESHAAIAARIGVSRQRVDVIIKELEKFAKANATRSEIASDGENDAATESTMGGLHETQLHGLHPSDLGPARSGIATERQRLLDLAPDQQMETLIHKVLRGSAPRAAAIAVGITSKQFSTRLERDEKFRDLVLRAAHEAEGSVAENLYAQATGRSPQNVQAAIAWLEKRMPEAWGREAQRIEIELTGAVDVNHILSNPKLIEEVSRHEARMQQLEDEAIDAEFRELPSHDEVPPLPEVELDSGPNPTRVNRPKDAIPETRPDRIVKVFGVNTLIGDERSPEDRNARPPF